jgi:glycosyltransferase 2 family protein
VSAEREWNIELLTAAEEGRRNRRTIDAILLAVAVLLAGAAAAIATSAPEQDKDLAQALITVLGWAAAFWRIVFVGALVIALVIVVGVLLSRRWALARDLLLALMAVVGVGILLGGLVDSDWLVIEPHVLSRWGFPELRVAAVTAVVTVAGPELVRPVRLLAFWLVGLAALGAVVIDAALPSDALGALALGLGAGLLVRLAFGTAAGVPSVEQVRLALSSLGVEVDGLKASARQRIGSAAYVALDRAGRPLKARVLGRDAQDTQMIVRRWRTLAYRDPPRSVAVGRLEQVEHEALATLLAAQARVRVPDVVTAALGPDGEALVVTREPEVDPLELAGEVSNETLHQLWEQAARLHKAGISHGRLNLSNVILVGDEPVLLDLSAATLGAPQSAIDIDVAELLVACTVLVGPDRALKAALDGVGKDAVGTALPYLQRAALTPHVRDLARTHEVALKDLRQAAATATGREKPPELEPLSRVSARKLLMTALLAVAAYGIITQLADIGFGTIADELRSADIAWVVVALILAQLTFVGSGISVRGTVLEPLALLPCVVLQSAIKFINLTVPSSAGRIAMNLRFLQRMGVPTPEALAAGAVDDASETVVQVALLLLAIPFVKGKIDTRQLHFGAPDGRLIAAIVIALVVSVTVMLAVPKFRAKVVPPFKRGCTSLWRVMRNRRKRLELFGGNVGSEVLYAIALGATCHAYGVDLSLAQLILVNTGASVLSSFIPVPGGIGAAEASLTAGLVAMGVDESTAFAIAFTQRLCTFYLPPIWGYFSLRWLSRKAYI